MLSVHNIGQSMPSALRETVQGGLAVTSAVRELEARIFGIPHDKRE